jgi:hypothetical protein
LLDPEAEDLLLTVEPDAESNIDGLVADHAFVADLDPQGIEENQRIQVLERRSRDLRGLRPRSPLTHHSATSSRMSSVTALISSGETSTP